MNIPSIRLIYDAGESGITYCNVEQIAWDVPFPQAVKEALDRAVVGMLRSLAFDLIPAGDSYENKLREQIDAIKGVVR